MTGTELAASFAIAQAKRQNRAEIERDDLLLGCLQTIAQFGIVRLGPWTIDLEAYGVDWMQDPGSGGGKVAYSQAVVDLFDLAARVAKLDGAGPMRVEHLLAVFASEEGGLMGQLKREHSITSSAWRAAVAERMPTAEPETPTPPQPAAQAGRDYLTPEEAAEALSIHVQTLRAYIRSGKLPALRLAGERAIRIRRSDLGTVLEPLIPQS